MTDVLPTADSTPRDKQQELRAAKEAVAGPVPLIPDAPDCTYLLPRGLFHRGIWLRDIEVRELTGADEEVLSKTKDPLAFFSTVIALGTVRIGDVDLLDLPVVERRGMLNELLIGEREQVYVQIVRASFGEEKVVGYRCGTCQVEQEMTLLLSEDFKPKEVGDIDQMTFTFTTSKGDVLECRPALGSDQEEIISKRGASLAEQNTTLLSRCITKRNDGLIPDPIGYVRALGMRDRQQLMVLLMERQPSISMEVTTTCLACGASQTIPLGWGDLFRP